jgi:heme-degrading monooxygenase HmoA
VIARTWRGETATHDADAYVSYLEETGLKAYRETPGNLAALLLRRSLGETTEFVTFSLWESMDAIRAFAGDDPERAVFYPEDDRYLVARDLTVTHHEVME